MSANEVINAITALGLGSSVGAIVTAVIAARSQKGKARAEAADLIMNAAEKVGKLNETLNVEVAKLHNDIAEIRYAIFHYLSGQIGKDELLEVMNRSN